MDLGVRYFSSLLSNGGGNRTPREVPESAHSGPEALRWVCPMGVVMSRPARGTMAHFCRLG